ncbi:MAG: hypothetical protein N2049_07425 [Anaerolineales bacterium]|nr:hypothetical protein [Anaerolineales bacterium]MCX7609031.1 hypothetical protein [Anaerolineales bacterium]MDW8226630.1 hypothetical protein [Anaerolineales bacterium]
MLRIFAGCLFTFGALVGLVFFAVGSFADLESVLFGFDRYGYKMASSFDCPVLLDAQETGVVRFVITNRTKTNIRPNVVFQTSAFPIFRTERQVIALAPGEKAVLEWTVGQEDLAYRHFIFAKVYTFASYPAPDVEQTCGILVLDLPFLTGAQAVALLVVVSLVSMGVGGGLWMIQQSVEGQGRSTWSVMLTLAGVVLVGMGSVWLAIWPLGVLLATLSLVLIGVIVGHFVQGGST